MSGWNLKCFGFQSACASLVCRHIFVSEIWTKLDHYIIFFANSLPLVPKTKLPSIQFLDKSRFRMTGFWSFSVLTRYWKLGNFLPIVNFSFFNNASCIYFCKGHWIVIILKFQIGVIMNKTSTEWFQDCCKNRSLALD